MNPTVGAVLPKPSAAAVAALAPSGVLRAAINLSNFLLVSSTSADGIPSGVSPDLARALASQLGCDLDLITFNNPGELADAVGEGVWDIGNIGAEPARAVHIAFSPAYAEIECTYLVPPGSPIERFADADQPGLRISVKARAAYALWLERNISHAELVLSPSLDESFTAFVEQHLDALAGLRPKLTADAAKLPGSTVLSGGFTSVQQAVGTPNNRNPAGATYLAEFVEAAKATGLVADLITRHKADGLTVAPLAHSTSTAPPKHSQKRAVSDTARFRQARGL